MIPNGNWREQPGGERRPMSKRQPKVVWAGIVLLASVIACLGACTSERLESRSVDERIDALIGRHVDDGMFSGVVLVARGEEIIFEKGYGFSRLGGPAPDGATTLFEFASTSKLITRAAALLEHDRGELSVDDRIGRFLPGYPRGDEITIAHLIHNTSGIPDLYNTPAFSRVEDFAGPITVDEIIELFRNLPLDYEPGTRLGYSSPGYVLLARIVEKSSGIPFGEFLATKIFEPLGMATAGHLGDDVDPPDLAVGYVRDGGRLEPAPEMDRSFLFGAGGVYGSARDLYRFCSALREGELLSDESMARFTSCSHYGHNFGFRSGAATIPSEDLVIVVLSNLDDAPMEEIVPAITTILLSGTVQQQEWSNSEEYFGRYQAERFDKIDTEIEVGSDRSRLTLRVAYPAGDPILMTLHPAGDDRFFTTLGEGTSASDGVFTTIVVDFHRDATGTISGLTLDISGWLIAATPRR